ncbi:MAG: hypothetical protein JKY50_09820 [Oleispira sp.]|nr:hypothetical protein [Oleispira sp.]MBL4880680.1 hypothetical protein [Oleispira sp.]
MRVATIAAWFGRFFRSRLATKPPKMQALSRKEATMNPDELNIQSFVSLKKLEQGCYLKRIEICSQSIYHWLQFCEYHYSTLIDAATTENLRRDRYLQIQRKGENVKLRFVYEAHISGFLNSLHSLLDSFPYLLHLFIPISKNLKDQDIKWSKDFLCKYNDHDFFTTLIDFIEEENFQKVKGYVNRIKHKHLIRVSNQGGSLEFEEFDYRLPTDILNKKYQNKSVENQNVLEFIADCYDDLIPKFFTLCNAVLDSKRMP